MATRQDSAALATNDTESPLLGGGRQVSISVGATGPDATTTPRRRSSAAGALSENTPTGLMRNMTAATFGSDDMPAEEAVFLNPVEKFVRYRVFPWKLIIHSCILVLLLVVTFAHHTEISSYNLNARFGLARSFYDMADNTDPSLKSSFRQVDDAIAFIRQIAQRYYDIPENSPGVFMHYVEGPDDSTPIPPLLRLKVIATPDVLRSSPLPKGVQVETLETNLTSTNDFKGLYFYRPAMFPFENVTHPNCPPRRGYAVCRNDSLAELFDRVISGEILMHLRSVRFYESSEGVASIARWQLSFKLAIESHGSEITITAKISNLVTCSPPLLAVVVTSLLVPFTFLHLLLRLRAFQRYHVHMRQLVPKWAVLDHHGQRAHRERHAGTSWKVFAISVDVLNLIFLVLSFVDIYGTFGNHLLQIWRKLFLGFSVAGYSVLFVSYLQTSPQFYVLIKAISQSIPMLLRYSAGVFPVFFGYAIAGTVMVGPWAQNTFGTLQLSLCTLFCIMNGDSLLQLSTQINQSDYWLTRQMTRLFMFTFLAYFYNNAMNVALAIVQDMYTQVREMFEMCEWDLDKCNEEIDLWHLSAAERRRRKEENRRRRHVRSQRRFTQYETGSTTDDASETTSTSSSDFSALGRGEVTPQGLRKLADRIQRIQPPKPAEP